MFSLLALQSQGMCTSQVQDATQEISHNFLSNRTPASKDLIFFLFSLIFKNLQGLYRQSFTPQSAIHRSGPFVLMLVCCCCWVISLSLTDDPA